MDKKKRKGKWDFEKVKDKFEENGYTLLEDEYLGYTIKHRYICKQGHESDTTFQSFLSGNRCRYCHNNQRGSKHRKTIEEVRKEFKERSCILLSTEYINNKLELDFICECGKRDSVPRTQFLNGRRCKDCGRKKMREAHLKHNIEFARAKFSERDLELLEVSYLNVDHQMKCKCKACGFEAAISLASILRNTGCRVCAYADNSGENHYKWNWNLTDEERANVRNIEGYAEWRLSVYKRDKYTCQLCGDNRGGNLNAHHLDGYDWCVEKRTDTDNGITLCCKCHSKFHKDCGFGGNTKQQFCGWLENQKESEVGIIA